MPVGKPASLGVADEANERLLVEAAQRDPARFADLYEINFELVYAYIARRVQDRGTAEDQYLPASSSRLLKNRFGVRRQA